MNLKGIAHLTLTVNNFQASLPFYQALFQHMGLREMIVQEGYYYCVGKRIGLGIQRAGSEDRDEPFDQDRTGLHHFCLALHSREDVDEISEFFKQHGGTVVRAPAAQDAWFPGMYSVLCEDPNGIRIEANHITPQT